MVVGLFCGGEGFACVTKKGEGYDFCYRRYAQVLSVAHN